MSDELHLEDWEAAYGSPYLVDEEAPGEDAELAEPDEPFVRTPETHELRGVAYVDGVRRFEGNVCITGGPTGCSPAAWLARTPAAR